MFSKDRKSASTTTSPLGKEAPKAQPKNAVPSIISVDLKVTGDLMSHGDIQIDGTIDGDVSAGTLTIGEHAKVNGSVVAEKVKVCGTVVGQVRAKSVTLAPTAKVTGDVVHETLGIEPGAYIDGQCRRMDAHAADFSVIPGATSAKTGTTNAGDTAMPEAKKYAS